MFRVLSNFAFNDYPHCKISTISCHFPLQIALKHDDVKCVNRLLAQCILGFIQGSPAILFINTAAFATLSNLCVFTLLCHRVNFACLRESIAARNNMAETLVIFQESDIKGALLPEKVVGNIGNK